jgi:hypothetical protein
MHFKRFHIRATSGRCCPSVRTVVLVLHVITIIRTASGRCFPDVQTITILLHVLPYQGPRPDGVALSSRRMQLSSHICVCEGNLISCRTLMSVRMDATLNYLNPLDTDGGRPNEILGSDFCELKFAQNLL